MLTPGRIGHIQGVKMEIWMESLLAFVQERWLIILLAVVAAIVIINVLKTVFKWLIAAVIILALVYYGLQYSEELREVSQMIKEFTVNEWNEMMERETESAVYEQRPDGSFVITSKNIKLEGSDDSESVVITIRGASITVTKNEIIKAYIEQAKQNAAKHNSA